MINRQFAAWAEFALTQPNDAGDSHEAAHHVLNEYAKEIYNTVDETVNHEVK
jgi:hypothetical protein